MSYNEYTEHLKNSGTPFIGMLAWYHVSESAEVKQPELEKLVDETGAPIKVPGLAAPANIFRRACSESGRSKVPTGKPGTFYNFLIRDLGYDDICVRRMLVAEQVDSKQRNVDYDVLSRLTYNKVTKELSFEDNENERDPATLKVADEIKSTIEEYLTTKALIVSPVVMRSVLRNTLETSLFGTSVRQGGGVYFIRMDFSEQLEAAEAVCNALDGVHITMLPLVDDEKQRSMVRDAFRDESSSSISDLIARMKELLGYSGPVPAKKYEEVLRDYKTIKGKVSLYDDILSSEKLMLETSLEVANAQLQSLLVKG